MNMYYLTSVLTTPITWVVFVFGLCVGSFLNVCIYRIPEGNFFKSARSFCPACNTTIPWYYNIPVLGYLILRGRSACCHNKISIQYPLVELFTGILFIIIFWKFPFIEFSNGVISFDSNQMIRAGYAVIFCCALIVCSVIDLHFMIIPDSISLSMVALTPVAVWIHPDLNWLSSLLGVFIGGGILYGIAWLYWLVRKDYGLGMGDVKLLAGIGGWLGYQAIFPTVLIASVVGSLSGLLLMVIMRKLSLRSQIPFGPFLSLGAILHLLIGQQILEFLAK